MSKPREYRHIAALGAVLGTDPSRISELQALAAFDDAPADAVFKHHGKWKCHADMNDTTRALIARWLAEHHVNGGAS